jgi:hypothetical protein
MYVPAYINFETNWFFPFQMKDRGMSHEGLEKIIGGTLILSLSGCGTYRTSILKEPEITLCGACAGLCGQKPARMSGLEKNN